MKRGRQPQIPFTPTQPLETILRREARQRGLSLSALVREALLLRYAPEIAALDNSDREVSGEQKGSVQRRPFD